MPCCETKGAGGREEAATFNLPDVLRLVFAKLPTFCARDSVQHGQVFSPGGAGAGGATQRSEVGEAI